MVWITDFKIFLRWSSVDLQVQPLPPSLCQHLELSRCSCSLCCVCRSWCAAVSISSTGGVPAMSWALWAHSPYPQGWLPHSFGEESQVLESCASMASLFICCCSLLMPRNLGGLFLFSDFISWVSLLVSLFKNFQKSVIRAMGAFFFFGPHSLSFIKTKLILTELICAPWGGFFCYWSLDMRTAPCSSWSWEGFVWTWLFHCISCGMLTKVFGYINLLSLIKDLSLK